MLCKSRTCDFDSLAKCLRELFFGSAETLSLVAQTFVAVAERKFRQGLFEAQRADRAGNLFDDSFVLFFVVHRPGDESSLFEFRVDFTRLFHDFAHHLLRSANLLFVVAELFVFLLESLVYEVVEVVCVHVACFRRENPLVFGVQTVRLPDSVHIGV